jgi:hypothetical protein
MKKGNRPILKWFTAFILSPGMIFASAYMAVWLSTNIYLARSFKHHLQNIFLAETGQRYQLDIGSLRPGFDLNSITLKKLALTPVGTVRNPGTQPYVMQIPELRIDCPDLGFFLFSGGNEILSMQQVSRKILSYAGQ